jgi:hypothetical protein
VGLNGATDGTTDGAISVSDLWNDALGDPA